MVLGTKAALYPVRTKDFGFDAPIGGAVGKIRPLPTVGGKQLPLDRDSYLKRIVLCHHSQFLLPWHPPSRRRMFIRTDTAIKRVGIF